MADGISALVLPEHTASLVGNEEVIIIANNTVKKGDVSLFGTPPFTGIDINATPDISLTTLTTIVENGVVGNVDINLPAGTSTINGRFKIITAGSLVGSVTINTTDGIGFSSVVLTNTGNSIFLQYYNGWRIVGKNIG